MSGYIGTQPVPQATQVRDIFTATSGQTVFNTAGYTVGYLDAYLNGVHLVPNTDYTANDGSTITLTSGATIGDTLEVVAFSTFESADTVSASSGGTFGGDINVSGTVNADGLEINTDNPQIQLYDTGAGGTIWRIANGPDGNGKLTFNDNDTERVTFTNDGNVGIGTSSPDANLVVYETATSGTDHFAQRWRTQSGGVLSIACSDLSLANPTWQIRSGSSEPIAFNQASNERMRINSSGNVGIGTSSPTGKLGVNGHIDIANAYSLRWGDGNERISGNNSGYLNLFTNNLERMRIDSSGNVLVGKTSTDNTTQGIRLFGSAGFASFVRDSAESIVVNRLTNNGDLIEFRKDSGTCGIIGSSAGGYTYYTGGSAGLLMRSSDIIPTNGSGSPSDNTEDLGDALYRFDDVFATNGTIQTSDRNEKQDIEELSDAEQRVATACKGLMRKFRWKSAVEEKGEDARIHFGIIAQDLQAAFEAEGLDAGKYAMFISTTWWEAERVIPAVEAVEEILDEDGNVLTEAVEAVEEHTVTDTFDTLDEAPEGAVERTRMGVRYSELLAFIIGAI